MKTLRLLVTLLLVVLSTGLCSCGGDDIDRESNIAEGTDESFIQYGITDYKDILRGVLALE